MSAAVQASFMTLQDDICRQLSEADGQGVFREDSWERPGGGGGRTRILEGKRIEKVASISQQYGAS